MTSDSANKSQNLFATKPHSNDIKSGSYHGGNSWRQKVFGGLRARRQIQREQGGRKKVDQGFFYAGRCYKEIF